MGMLRKLARKSRESKETLPQLIIAQNQKRA